MYKVDEAEELKVLVKLATNSAAKLLSNKEDKVELIKYITYTHRLDELGYKLDFGVKEI